MNYAVDNHTQGWFGWYTSGELEHMATLMDEEGDYQSDSPEANFITGYNTDSYADESIAILRNGWDYYLEDCEDEEVTPTVDGYLDTLWEDFDYQLLHTWLRVTNLRMDDNEIVTFARVCDKGQITQWLEEGEITPLPCDT